MRLWQLYNNNNKDDLKFFRKPPVGNCSSLLFLHLLYQKKIMSVGMIHPSLTEIVCSNINSRMSRQLLKTHKIRFFGGLTHTWVSRSRYLCRLHQIWLLSSQSEEKVTNLIMLAVPSIQMALNIEKSHNIWNQLPTLWAFLNWCTSHLLGVIRSDDCTESEWNAQGV